MIIEHKGVNFEDTRGTITDIFVQEPKEHCTIIVSKKGAVRGNHYHKFSQQSDFIISGSFEIYGKKMDDGEVTTSILKANDLVTWEASEAHEFIALEDTVFITFVNGPRGGEEFEKDTYRLETPLHEQFLAQKKV